MSNWTWENWYGLMCLVLMVAAAISLRWGRWKR